MQHPFIQEDLYALKTTNLVVVEKDYYDMPIEEKQLLNNILDSINQKLSYQQLHCVFSAENIDQLIQKYQVKKILAFTNNPSEEVQSHPSGARILFAGNLQELNSSEGLKKQLWAGLKKLFTQ